MAPALLLVWIPAGIGLMVLSWSATTFGIRSDWLDAAATVVGIVAVATLVLGAVGAFLHDDLIEVVVYSIVQDSAFILLALASRDAGAAEPARLWLLAFVAAKTAFVAWAAAASGAFGSSDLRKLRWLRRAPASWAWPRSVAAATLGWPQPRVRGTLDADRSGPARSASRRRRDRNRASSATTAGSCWWACSRPPKR